VAHSCAVDQDNGGRSYDLSRFPDFFIVGAPKSGTTALYSYLSQHPDVFMPKTKEPNYFSADIWDRTQTKSQRDYLALFAKARPGALTGEASPFYLFSELAPKAIHTANSAAKIIVMLRKPQDAARSFHQHLLRWRLDDIDDFEDSWHLQPARVRGDKLPRYGPDPKVLQYGRLFSYSGQIARLKAIFPDRQCHYIVYEEFFADPARHYAETLAFLGLKSDNRTSFPRVNETRSLRFQFLALLTRGGPPVNVWVGMAVDVLRFLERRGCLKKGALRAFNEVDRATRPVPPAFADELDRYFAPDIAATEKLLGRPIDAWH
jgi:Sulfotransferase domain